MADLLFTMNLETPPSIEEDACVWAPGVIPRVVEEDGVRRVPFWPAAKFESEVFRGMSEAVGLAVADMDDIAGGAFAESDGLRIRAAIPLGSRPRVASC